MVPVRDGIKLETVIFTPTNARGPLPILFRRTPYGVPSDASSAGQGSLSELARDGYIFVVQNLRGRFGSEGTFELSSQADLENPKATSETTDAYDTIDWLVKNVPNNNGKVGMFGVSYDGLTSAMTLLRPHPALAAISEQASPADQWMNDDDHRYGAARELRSSMPSTSRRTRTRTRILTSRPTTPTRGTSTSVRCRTSTPSTCTGRFRTGTRSSSTPTTTSSGRRKRG
jgi:putative CocE/NonD family hydrolase